MQSKIEALKESAFEFENKKKNTEAEMDIEKKNMEASRAKEMRLEGQIVAIKTDIEECMKESVRLNDQLNEINKKRDTTESQIIFDKEKLAQELTKLDDKK